MRQGGDDCSEFERLLWIAHLTAAQAVAVEEHEPSSTALDNSDFANTEIPFDFPLPEQQHLGEAEREKVRDYVLELSMNANVQQALNHDELHAIFSEADVLRDACMRGGRAAGASDELLSIVQAAV